MSTLERVTAETPLALTAAIAGIAGSFAVSGWTPRFVVVPVDQFVVESTPGSIVTWAILALGETGHVLHVGLAIAIVCTLFAAVGLAARAVAKRRRDPVAGCVLGALAIGVGTLWLTGSVLSALATAVPVGVVLFAPALRYDHSNPLDSRRDLLRLAGGLLPAIGLSYLLGRTAGRPETIEPLPDREAHDELLSAAADRNLAVDGLGELVTDVDDFYTIDIASSPPRIDADAWTLRITGAVDREPAFTYEDLTDRDPERRFVTLRCIGEPLDGDLIDTALWTGVPVASLLEEADPGGDCECVMVRADDGYYERFPLEALRRSFLAYGMNGETLPASNGYPVRLLVPGHWGKINVKWITEIEVLEEEADGFWQQRGWHGTGPVETVAKLSLVERDGGRVQLGGHAYAGTRGVDRVEVSVDGGDSWVDARLSEPLPAAADEDSVDAWRQWAYAFETAPDAEHEVVVRAVDGTGELQAETESDAFPSGPTGWVRETV